MSSLATLLTYNILAHKCTYQWEMMTEVVNVLRDREVAPSPLMVTLCTRHVPTSLRDQLLRKLGDMPAPKGTVEGGKQNNSKGTQRLQKQKKLNKLQKLKEAEESSLTAYTELQYSNVADSQGQNQPEQESKKKSVKC